ncbi:MAG TPA: hypothetical protein VII99_16805 [Bacteroidia bacterium]
MKSASLLIFVLWFGLHSANAQVGYSRDEVISKFGNDFFKTGVSDIGEQYIIYKMQDTSASGIYTKTMGFYFKKSESGTLYCNEQFIMEPLSELKKWVDYLNGKFEKISEKEYRDKASKIIYRVSIIDNQCSVRIWYE